MIGDVKLTIYRLELPLVSRPLHISHDVLDDRAQPRQEVSNEGLLDTSCPLRHVLIPRVPCTKYIRQNPFQAESLQDSP